MPTSPVTQVNEYAAAVRSGALPSCLMVRKAVDRFWYDMKDRDDVYFDHKTIKLIIAFVSGDKSVGWEGLKHFKGEWAGQTIVLEPWELFVVLCIFGWKDKSTKKRHFIYADVNVPRKNGKTTLAAVIALIMLIIDGEPAAEVYSFAVDKEQAKICFDASVQIANVSGLTGEVVKYFRKGSLVVEDTASAYKPLSKDTKNKDGLNPHCGIGDECHAWKTFEMYELIQTGMGARSQPLLFLISTAGVDTTYPYFAHLEYLRQILLGIKKKDNHFILIFEPDEGDDWHSEETWKKVNPSYGACLYPKYIRESYEDAVQKGGSTLAAFQTKNLNMWVDAPEVWIPDDDVAACNAEFDESQLEGAECWVGMDLAATGDITATALLFPKFNVVKFIFLVPEEKLKDDKRQDIVDYRLWVEQGWLVVCPGKIMDKDWYISYLMNHLPRYKVKGVAFDPWNAWELKGKMGRYEDVMEAYNQGIKYMYPPSKKIFEMVKEHQLNFLDNPIIRWMFKNVVIYMDPNNNYKPDKGKSRNKIDGVVALCDAIGLWLTKTSEGSGQIYTDMKFHTVPRI